MSSAKSAPLVRQLDDDEDLLEVLVLRRQPAPLAWTESNQVLQGVVRGTIADEPVPDLRRPSRAGPGVTDFKP